MVAWWLPCKFHYILKLLARASVILYVATLRTRKNNNYYLYGVGVNSYYNILLLLLLLWCYNNNISYTLYDTRHCFHHCDYFGGNDGLKETHTSTTVVVVRNRQTKINEKITLVPAFDFILCKPNTRNRPILELEIIIKERLSSALVVPFNL